MRALTLCCNGRLRRPLSFDVGLLKMSKLTDNDIDGIEKSVGLRLPDDVRARYHISNGLTGPTDCQFLYTVGLAAATDILGMNALRNESWFPSQFHSVILIGDDGCGNLIGFDWETHQAILWNPTDGDLVQERKNSVTEMWEYITTWYARTTAAEP